MGMQSEIRTAVKWDTPSVNTEDRLRDAIQQMVTSKVSALVVKMNDTVVGVICDIDLIKSIIDKKDLDETKVSELMTACELITAEGAANPCAQIDGSESAENALKVLEAAGVHNLLVSGAGDKDVGIVSIHNLLELAIS